MSPRNSSMIQLRSTRARGQEDCPGTAPSHGRHRRKEGTIAWKAPLTVPKEARDERRPADFIEDIAVDEPWQTKAQGARRAWVAVLCEEERQKDEAEGRGGREAEGRGRRTRRARGRRTRQKDEEERQKDEEGEKAEQRWGAGGRGETERI